MSNQKVSWEISTPVRRSLQILGIIISLLAFIFVIQRIWTIGRSAWDQLLSINILIIIVMGGVAHGVNYFLIGLAWQKLLVWFGETKALPRISLIVYGRTQIAKYLPGNFFHYPTRHLMGNRVGFHHPALVGAAFYEIIGILVAAGTISLIGLPKSLNIASTIYMRVAIILLVLVLSLLLQFFLVRFSIGRKLGFPEKSVSNAFRELLPIWAIYLVFFIIEGLILWGIVGGVTGSWFIMPYLYIVSTFTISWVVGFLTPGAPAGLGVRDAVMILILTYFLGAPAAAFTTLIARLVATIGDLVNFLISIFLFKNIE
jgi:uncharacterized membrane protein YbhN (UPF0104 family)